MKKVIGMFALLLLGSPLAAEESKDDPVLMKINGKNITRGEFATITARFLSNPYSTKDRFYDTEGHWAEVYINRAAEEGWINGYSDGTFKPDQAITRAEAVTLVNNVLGRKPHADHMLPEMVTWPDNPKSAWYYEAIQEATNSHDYRWSSSKSYEIWTELLENRD